ncbi:MAG: molybdenum cofactor guanylyltransferase [Coriobacteriales bacterium]
MPEHKRIENLSIVVQAGGESKRMGSDKALVTFLGAPLIMRPIRRLYPICSEMVVTTNNPEKMDFLQSYIDSGRMHLASDKINHRGALVGIHTALSSATLDYAALVACDMVFPSSELIRHLHGILEETGADVAIPTTHNGFEPFHAVYRRETCLAAVEDALENGLSKATAWFPAVNVVEVGSEEIQRVNPRGGSFVNVNTPDELHELERRIIEKGIPGADED